MWHILTWRDYGVYSGSGGGGGGGALFALSSSLKSSANSIKEVLLQWCQCRTRGYEVHRLLVLFASTPSVLVLFASTMSALVLDFILGMIFVFFASLYLSPFLGVWINSYLLLFVGFLIIHIYHFCRFFNAYLPF